MLSRLLPLALALTICPLTAFAQTPPAAHTPPAAQTPPAAPTPPASTDPSVAPAKHPHVGGKISAVDAAAKTITLMHHKKTVVVSVPDTAKIYKVGDAKGQPTGTFADLTVDAQVSVSTKGDEAAPVAKSVHLRAPKPATPATP